MKADQRWIDDFGEEYKMNTMWIGENIKKLRDERKLTQQQLADSLGVTFQTVSKWECNTTTPDIAMLPEIAEFFDVTIDELFKPGMMAYRNKAERLMAKYESDIEQSDVFEMAVREFEKLIAENNASATDLGNYAYLNDLRSQYYAKIAESYYNQAIEKGKLQKDTTCYKNQRQYISFLARMGRHQENIDRHVALLKEDPDNVMNVTSLVAAYHYAGDYENAIQVAEKGLRKFPDDALLLVYAGNSYKRLGQSDQAVQCWNKAFAIDPDMIDTRYSIAFYYMESKQYDKAREVLLQIIEWNRQRGFDLENKWINNELKKLEAGN